MRSHINAAIEGRTTYQDITFPIEIRREIVREGTGTSEHTYLDHNNNLYDVTEDEDATRLQKFLTFYPHDEQLEIECNYADDGQFVLPKTAMLDGYPMPMTLELTGWLAQAIEQELYDREVFEEATRDLS